MTNVYVHITVCAAKTSCGTKHIDTWANFM